MKRKYIWLAVILLAVFAAFWGFKEFNRVRKDTRSMDASFYTDANALLQEFATNEKAANQKYAGLNVMVAITGMLKQSIKSERGHYTLLLGEANSLSSVRCSIDTVYSAEMDHWKIGQTIRIKGNFNGYKPDDLGIGADVEFNYCVVDSPSVK